MNMKPVQISLPKNSHNRLMQFAKHIGCVSGTGKPKAASTILRTLRTVMEFYSNETFLKKIDEEGIDTLAFIQKCVKKEIKPKNITENEK